MLKHDKLLNTFNVVRRNGTSENMFFYLWFFIQYLTVFNIKETALIQRLLNRRNGLKSRVLFPMLSFLYESVNYAIVDSDNATSRRK